VDNLSALIEQGFDNKKKPKHMLAKSILKQNPDDDIAIIQAIKKNLKRHKIMKGLTDDPVLLAWISDAQVRYYTILRRMTKSMDEDVAKLASHLIEQMSNVYSPTPSIH